MAPSRTSGVLLYGIGSPLIVDIEESCARAGMRIVAGVRNFGGPVYVSDAVRVAAPDELNEAERKHRILIGLFTPGFRRRARDEAQRSGFATGATLVDPTSPVAGSAELGEGVYVNAGVAIGCAARIGNWVLVNRSASIGHHGVLGDFVSIGPGAVLGGNVSVGRGSMIGMAAVIMSEVDIGSNAVVAAGSVVRFAVAANTLVAGNPARIVKTGIAGYKDLSA